MHPVQQPIEYLAINRGTHKPEGRFYAKHMAHARQVARALFPKCYLKTPAQYAKAQLPCDMCLCRPCMCGS